MVMESKSTKLDQQALELLSTAVVEENLQDNLAEPDVTFENVENFRFSTEMRIVGVCSGRISERLSKEILDIFDAIGVFDISKEVCQKIPPGYSLTINVKPKIEFESNSLALVYFQVTKENENDFDKKIVLLHLFKAMVEEHLYTKLRLNERLGYEIGFDIHIKSDIFGLYLYVLSTHHFPNLLLQMIDPFVASIAHYLENVEDKEFQTYKSKTCIPDNYGISHHLVNDVMRIGGLEVRVERGEG